MIISRKPSRKTIIITAAALTAAVCGGWIFAYSARKRKGA